MNIFSEDLDKINLDDVDCDEDDPETIIHVNNVKKIYAKN